MRECCIISCLFFCNPSSARAVSDKEGHSIYGKAMTQEDRLHLLPKKFDDSGNFDNWVSNFECISLINSWSKEEKALSMLKSRDPDKC